MDFINFQSPRKPLLQVLHNPSFPTGMDNYRSFRAWQERDLISVHKLTNATGMKPFPELQRDHDLPGSELFRYLQLKNYVEQIVSPGDGSLPPSRTWFEWPCRNDPHAKGMITGMYNRLQPDPSRHVSLYVSRLQEDMGKTFTEEEWKQIWLSAKRWSNNGLAQETTSKVISRWYRTPTVVDQFALGVSSACFRGCGQEGAYFHTWWQCPVAQTFWNWVFGCLDTMFGGPHPIESEVALPLHKSGNLTIRRFKLETLLFTASKQVKAKEWRTPHLHTSEVMSRMQYFLVNV